MLQWFMSFPQFAEILFYLGKTQMFTAETVLSFSQQLREGNIFTALCLFMGEGISGARSLQRGE